MAGEASFARGRVPLWTIWNGVNGVWLGLPRVGVRGELDGDDGGGGGVA